MESKRRDLERQIPNFQQIRETLDHQVSCKVDERTAQSSGKPVTNCHFISAGGSEIEQPFHDFKGFTNFGA